MTSAITKIKGITFIELLIVIIIAGILAGVSTPLFRKTMDNLSLENFVKDIYYLSCYLQASAVNEGKIYSLNIDRYAVAFRGTYKEANELRNINGKLGRSFIAPKGVTITYEPADKPNVYFYPDGTIDKVTVSFKNQHENTLSLIIKGVSGEIKVQ